MIISCTGKNPITPSAPNEEQHVENPSEKAPKPGTLTAEKTAYTTIKVDWTTATDKDTPKNMLEYKLVYSTNRSQIDTSELADSNGTVALDWSKEIYTKAIENLGYGTTYYLALIVKDFEGNKAIYEIAQVKTTTYVEILKSGVTKWNNWRTANPTINPSLAGADLMSANLQGANLNKVNLSTAVLYNANLKNANLDGANLSYASLMFANLSNASLKSANLSRSNIYSATLSNANLRSANLDYAKLSYAKLNSAILTSAKMKYGDLNYADLSSADLSNISAYFVKMNYATLTRAKFVKAYLRAADIIGCKLIYTDFTEANLRAVDMSYTARGRTGVIFNNADLKAAVVTRSFKTLMLNQNVKNYNTIIWTSFS